MKKILIFCVLFVLIDLKITIAQTVTDIDGNVYNTVTIGSQVWMKSNLNTSKYNDGTTIQNVTDSATWINLTTGAYCDYNNTPSNSVIYSKLYNWYAVTNSSNLCPTNWHIPNETEWNKLEKFLDYTVDTTSTNWTGTTIGSKLKEAGSLHWCSISGSTNSSEFTALPGGSRYKIYNYSMIGANGFWWSLNAYDATDAWMRSLVCESPPIRRSNYAKICGFSVRCISDFAADINEMVNNEQIKIYPNPTTDKLIIEAVINSKIEIINIQSQIVKTISIVNSITTIDISNLVRGFYTVKIITNNGFIARKLIKE